MKSIIVPEFESIRTNGLRRKWYTIPLKNISKIPQFFVRGARS
jgi:hypothetical protein